MQAKPTRPLLQQVKSPFFSQLILLSNIAVSYLFRSLGSVVGLSVGATLVQGTLRSSLQRKLSGQDVDEVSPTSLHFLTAK
jgi:hypothetical protein